jgi:hypothetical protein
VIVAVRVDALEHRAAVGVDAVVAAFEANEGRHQIDGPPAVGEDVELELDVEDVVPLREVELVVVDAVLLAHPPDLHFDEAVRLDPPVEGLQRSGGGRPQQ